MHTQATTCESLPPSDKPIEHALCQVFCCLQRPARSFLPRPLRDIARLHLEAFRIVVSMVEPKSLRLEIL